MRAVGAARARRPNDANYRIRSGLTSSVAAARCSEPASGSAFRLAYGSATRRPRQPFVHHVPGRKHLWRAVDQSGEVLDVLVQEHRDAKSAKRFFRKLLKVRSACIGISRLNFILPSRWMQLSQAW
jgi:hypothetical protein